jgi:pimeloyl-ACP methyl ester carboxylesterase
MKKKIVILHGWTYSTEKWEPFVKALSGNDNAVVMVKVPGLTAPLEESWDLDDYVTWLRDILHKEKEPVVLIGHSNGGRIILAYALLYPEKIKQLFLIDSAGIYHKEFYLQVKRFIFKKLASLKKMVKGSIFKNVLYKLARESDYHNASPIMKKTMQNLIESDLSQQLSLISVPTTIIWGEEDKVTPVSDAKVMQKQIAKSKLFLIKEGRHSPQFTHTNEVVSIIKKQLS